MTSNNNSSNVGISFFGALEIAFIVLKLCGIINWPWWIVLLPIYGPIVIVIAIIIIAAIYDSVSWR